MACYRMFHSCPYSNSAWTSTFNLTPAYSRKLLHTATRPPDPDHPNQESNQRSLIPSPPTTQSTKPFLQPTVPPYTNSRHRLAMQSTPVLIRCTIHRDWGNTRDEIKSIVNCEPQTENSIHLHGNWSAPMHTADIRNATCIQLIKTPVGGAQAVSYNHTLQAIDANLVLPRPRSQTKSYFKSTGTRDGAVLSVPLVEMSYSWCDDLQGSFNWTWSSATVRVIGCVASHMKKRSTVNQKRGRELGSDQNGNCLSRCLHFWCKYA